MAERITVPARESVNLGTLEYEIEALVINFKQNMIVIHLVSPDESVRKQRTYSDIGPVIKNLMTGNYSVKSLPQKILEKIAKDDYNDTASVKVV